jgi:hypothetical protein
LTTYVFQRSQKNFRLGPDPVINWPSGPVIQDSGSVDQEEIFTDPLNTRSLSSSFTFLGDFLFSSASTPGHTVPGQEGLQPRGGSGGSGGGEGEGGERGDAAQPGQGQPHPRHTAQAWGEAWTRYLY